MDAKIEVERAERRLRAAKAHLANVTAGHAQAAAEMRTLEADAHRVDPDNTSLYARRSRDLTAARAQCSQCEEVITQAQREVDAAEAALRGPRTALWDSEVSALEASAPEVASATHAIIGGLAALFAARNKLRAALAASTATERRLSLLAADMAGRSKVEPAGEPGVLLRRAQALLWTTEKLRPDAIADPEYAAALARELRTRLELSEYAGTEPYAAVSQVADMVSGKYPSRTSEAFTSQDDV